MIEAKTVLVVEDERIVAEDISEILRSMGCFVCGIAASGLQAMELAIEYSPDLILMDVVLQGDMDGIEAACKINEIRDTPIIFLTAYSDRGVLERAKAVGPVGYIVKPFDDKNLRSTVEIALHKAQIERSLGRSRDWLVTGLRSIRDGVVAVDRLGQIEFMNKSAEEMIGISSMAAYGIELPRLNAFLEPDRTMLIESPVSETVTSGKIVECQEYLCRNRINNQSFPVEASAAPISDESKEIIGAIFVFRDITTRKKAEVMRAEQRQKLEETVEERTADLRSAYEGLLKEVAERKSIQHKLNSQISMERLSVEISSAFLKNRDEDQADAISANLHKLRQYLDFDFASVMDVSDNRIASLEYLSVQPDFQDCEINQLNGAVVSDALIRTIGRECFEWDNQSEMVRKAGGLLAILDDKEVCAALFVPMGYKSESRFILLGTFHGRRLETAHLGAALVMIGHIFCSAFDRLAADRERKILHAQLIQAQKMEAIGKLTGGIAHDFNNLLVPILGYSEMMLSDLPESSPLAAELEEINRAADAASMLTRQMLAFSRKQILSKSVWDLAELLEDLRRMLSSIIGEDIEMNISYVPDVYPIKADYSQIHQVFMNLCVNARAAMPDGGRLDIEMSSIDGEVLVSVSDTGCGIPSDRVEAIFEPFYTTKGQDGTGLGLSVVYGIVQQHHGMIYVTSVVGRGTTFFLKLPIADAKEVRAIASEPHQLENVSGQGNHILLVEDEAGVLRFMRHALEEINYQVSTACNLEQAISLYEEIGSNINLILTDAVLPDGNGLALLDHALNDRPDLGVILCSGYTDKNALLDLVRERHITFLQKPFSTSKLYRVVHDVISGLAVSTID